MGTTWSGRAGCPGAHPFYKPVWRQGETNYFCHNTLPLPPTQPPSMVEGWAVGPWTWSYWGETVLCGPAVSFSCCPAWLIQLVHSTVRNSYTPDKGNFWESVIWKISVMPNVSGFIPKCVHESLIPIINIFTVHLTQISTMKHFTHYFSKISRIKIVNVI